MKKIVAIILTMVLMLSLTACNGTTDKKDNGKGSKELNVYNGLRNFDTELQK